MPTDPGGKVAACLAYEAAVAGYFWLAYATDGFWWNSDSWPVIGLIPFALWLACPILTLPGLLMVRRSARVPYGWLQITVALVLAGSVWYEFTRFEWH